MAQRLAGTRLLLLRVAPEPGVEPAHESLLTQWKHLREAAAAHRRRRHRRTARTVVVLVVALVGCPTTRWRARTPRHRRHPVAR
ncbi:hypothetical protein ACFYOT_20370 [Saccharothrix saharensis]|uniref:hypothetical protein n=1 Tax=Saccharothrix saharensis TaxID=571190 RepID=UPI0036C1CFE3